MVLKKTNNIFCLGNTGTLSQKVCINPIVDDHLTVQYLFHQGLLGPVLAFYISAEGDGARDQMHCTVIQWKQRGFDTGSRQVQGWLVSWCFGPSQLLGLRLFHCFQAKTCANLSVLASPSYIEYNLRRFNVFSDPLPTFWLERTLQLDAWKLIDVPPSPRKTHTPHTHKK